ncbi:MAG: helix-turn-helix transcriptional regulator [Dehalococcoidia bacterium]|jgi:transcriptional regulator with XRE-family HTH domain
MKIREYLKLHNRTMEDLAASVGVNPSTLYRALSNTCEMKQGTLLRLSRETRIPVDQLINELGKH